MQTGKSEARLGKQVLAAIVAKAEKVVLGKSNQQHIRSGKRFRPYDNYITKFGRTPEDDGKTVDTLTYNDGREERGVWEDPLQRPAQPVLVP